MYQHNRRVKLALECLEDRTVPHTMNGTNLYDHFIVTEYDTTRAAVYLNTYLDANYTQQYGSTSWFNFPKSSMLYIDGFLGSDKLSVYGTAQCSVVFQGSGGTDSIYYSGRYVDEGITVTSSNVYGPVNLMYTGAESLVVDSGDGNDTVYVLSTSIPTTVQSSWGRESVIVGDVGSVQGIRGALTVKNTPSYTNLTIDNNRDTGWRNTYITANSITGLAPAAINYVGTDLGSFIIKGGKAFSSTYSIDGTPSSGVSGGLTTQLITGPDNDHVWIRASQGNLNVSTGGGFDNVYLGAVSGDPVYLLDLLGPITLNGGSGNNTVSLYDLDTFNRQSYRFTGTSFQRSGGKTVTFSNFQNINLLSARDHDTDMTFAVSAVPGVAQPLIAVQGGHRNNAYHVTTPPTQVKLVINVLNGFNTINGPDADTTWHLGTSNFFPAGLTLGVIHVNVGNLNPGYYTTSIGKVLAGSGNDTFLFTDEAIFEGVIDGGGGINTLDYANYTSDVYVNLRSGITPNLTLISNIQYVSGGAGNDILVGDGNHNALFGNGGRDLLIIGVDWGYLLGGEDDDILIAGTTAYDDDDASLFALRNYWTSGDDYDTRVANLLTGNGVPLLDASTVYSNGGNNQLLGQSGTDLFFTLLDYDVILDLIDGELESGL